MLGLNTLSESRQVSLKGYMIICSLFSLLPASPRPSWRGADTAKPRQDFLSSAMPSGRLRRVPSPRHPPSPKNNGQRLLLVCYFGSCRGRAEWKIVSPGALGAFQLRQRPVRLSAPGLRRPRAFCSSRVMLGGTEGLEANVALLRGERREDGKPWRGVWSRCSTVSADPVLGTSSAAQVVTVPGGAGQLYRLCDIV